MTPILRCYNFVNIFANKLNAWFPHAILAGTDSVMFQSLICTLLLTEWIIKNARLCSVFAEKIVIENEGGNQV